MHLAANTIFIWIPNCGGTSIAKHWFRKRLVIWNWKEGMKTETWVRDLETINQHATYDRYAVLYPNHNYITQVRNPYGRWQATYRHLHKMGLITTWSFEEYTERARRYLPEGRYIKLIEEWETVWDTSHSNERRLDHLFMPQWTFVRPEVEVHKLEEKTIWERLGVEEIHLNKGAEIDCSGEYKDFVADFYARDFETFNYDRSN